MVTPHKYSAEEHEFLREFIPGHHHKEIVDAFNSKFAYQITLSKVISYIGNHKLNTGFNGRFEKGNIPANKGVHTPSVGRMAETQFKPGHLPHNTKPIGYERVNKKGYIEVKVRIRPSKELRNFVPKHRLIWEEANGPIPKGYNVIFLDGNKRNFAIENLALISKSENLALTRQSLRNENAEFTKTGIVIAKSVISCNNAKKKIRRNKNGSED